MYYIGWMMERWLSRKCSISVLPVSEPRSRLLTENRGKVDELQQHSLEHGVVSRIKIVFTATTLTANEL